jgi:Domain of unknown function (DUF4387)
MRLPLSHVAPVIRSKNAGPFHLTFDIMFSDLAVFRHVLGTGQISQERFARTYRLNACDVHWTVYEPALGVKATIRRPSVSGDPDDSDIYGCQQHALLLGWDVDIPSAFMQANNSSD